MNFKPYNRHILVELREKEISKEDPLFVMPDDYKPAGLVTDVLSHARGDDAVKAYRAYYHSKADSPGGVHYRHTSPPDWWQGMEVTA